MTTAAETRTKTTATTTAATMATTTPETTASATTAKNLLGAGIAIIETFEILKKLKKN